jgi:sec-independent protein translocase protein TatA
LENQSYYEKIQKYSVVEEGIKMFEFSLPHLLIVLVIFLLIFGPSRLGDLGSSLGKGIKGFKKAMRDLDVTDITPNKEARQIQSPGLEAQSKIAEKEEVKVAS